MARLPGERRRRRRDRHRIRDPPQRRRPLARRDDGRTGRRRRSAAGPRHARRCPSRRRGDGARAGHPRLHPGVRGREQQHGDPAAVLHHRHVVGTGGVHPAVGAHPRRGLDRLRLAVPPSGRRPRDPLGLPRPLRGLRLLLRADGRARQPVRHRSRSDAGPRAELAPPGQPAGGHPPAAPLCRVRGLHRPVRVRDRHAGHGSGGGPLADRVPPLDPGRVHLPLRRHRAGRLVVLPGAGLGRVLGLGPGRERRPAPLALRDRLPALGPGAGAARPHARVEPLAVHRHLRAHHPRDVPHAFRGDHLRPCVLGVLPRSPAHRFFLRGGHRGLRVDRLAGGPIALAGWDRRPARPGGRVPAQQRAVRGLRLRRAARDPLPAPLRGAHPAAGHGRRSVLQHDRGAGRPDAALPHGRRTGAQLAQDERGGAVAAPRHSGVDRGGHRRAVRRLRPPRQRHADRFRPGCDGGGDRGPRVGALGARRRHAATSAGGAAWWGAPTVA